MSFTTDDGKGFDGDIFSLVPEVSNGLIIGSAGTGKSFLLNHVISKFLTESDKTRVFVITFYGYHEKLLKLLDGEDIRVNVCEGLSFTPVKRFVVLDLSDFAFDTDTHHRMPEVISAIQEMLTAPGFRNMVIFDEAWQVLSDETNARLIQNLYRDARKWNASVLIASQDPKDFLQTDAGQNILANSRIQIFLPNRVYKNEILKQFGLSDEEIETTKSLRGLALMEYGNYREYLLKYDERSKVICFSPTRAEYWTYTTHPRDMKTEAKFRAEHPDYTEAQIIEGLAIMHGGG